jgi:hypothetical protein
MLDTLGIPYIQSPEESDPVLSDEETARLEEIVKSLS